MGGRNINKMNHKQISRPINSEKETAAINGNWGGQREEKKTFGPDKVHQLSSFAQTPQHTQTHTHARTRTHTHARTHTPMHAHTHTCTHIHTITLFHFPFLATSHSILWFISHREKPTLYVNVRTDANCQNIFQPVWRKWCHVERIEEERPKKVPSCKKYERRGQRWHWKFAWS